MVSSSNGRVTTPDPELVERAKWRKFTAEYKARILAEADACKEAGEIGALLRREALYSSNLTEWRKQRKKKGADAALGSARGRKKADPLKVENERLRRHSMQRG